MKNPHRIIIQHKQPIDIPRLLRLLPCFPEPFTDASGAAGASSAWPCLRRALGSRFADNVVRLLGIATFIIFVVILLQPFQLLQKKGLNECSMAPVNWGKTAKGTFISVSLCVGVCFCVVVCFPVLLCVRVCAHDRVVSGVRASECFCVFL